MPTARDIITRALQDAGVTGSGLVPPQWAINDGFDRLNDMLHQAQVVRWMVYHLVDTDVPMTGATSYTVGPGQTFNVPLRPDRLEGARIIQNNPPAPNDVGWPLTLIQSKQNWNNIRMQHLGSFPTYAFYDADVPIGKVYFWPLPSNIYTGRITTKAILQTFANLTDSVILPPEWYRYLRFNLAVELAMANKLDPEPILLKLAKGAEGVIKVANFQLPTLGLPPELVRNGLYNIFTDNTI